MPANSTFAYRARDNSGAVVTGTMEAASAAEVSARLRTEGKYVVMVDDRPLRGDSANDVASIRRREAARRVRREDVIAFCQQLSVMLETGVPLAEALDAFCTQTPSREFRQVLDSLREDIYGGEPFSTAMSRWPRVFPRLMISLMKASEASGTMSMMLGRIGEYLAAERRTVKQIKSALSYPIFMMGAGLSLSLFLMIFILPRFAAIYESRSAALPAPTRRLLAISDFAIHQYMYYGPALVILGVIGIVGSRRPAGKHALDWMRLNTPILSVMYRQLYITRAARTMATLLGAGVNLLDIIDICRGVTNNVCFNVLWDEMERGVRDGHNISQAVHDSPYVTANIASMVSSGERSGKLALVMERIASFCQEELENAVKKVTSYIEPIMIICMGVVVGGVAMALLLPIFRMGNVMAGG